MGEIVKTAAYLINRCPSSAINLSTLEELWRERPTNHQKLKVIGCLVYAHIKQDKLEHRAVRCVMIGYPTEVKGYGLWCLESKKFIVRKDVTFNEKVMPLKTKITKS